MAHRGSRWAHERLKASHRADPRGYLLLILGPRGWDTHLSLAILLFLNYWVFTVKLDFAYLRYQGLYTIAHDVIICCSSYSFMM